MMGATVIAAMPWSAPTMALRHQPCAVFATTFYLPNRKIVPLRRFSVFADRNQLILHR
jgi:hypothetical protein